MIFQMEHVVKNMGHMLRLMMSTFPFSREQYTA